MAEVDFNAICRNDELRLKPGMKMFAEKVNSDNTMRLRFECSDDLVIISNITTVPFEVTPECVQRKQAEHEEEERIKKETLAAEEKAKEEARKAAADEEKARVEEQNKRMSEAAEKDREGKRVSIAEKQEEFKKKHQEALKEGNGNGE